jgi:hypothetical protein
VNLVDQLGAELPGYLKTSWRSVPGLHSPSRPGEPTLRTLIE